MAKRFTDTNKWKRPWFRQLPTAYKCLWVYICDECDLAGTWYVDMAMAAFAIGEPVTLETATQLFQKQVVSLDQGSRWQIRDFVPFQYGDLKPTNNLHRAVIGRLEAAVAKTDTVAVDSISAPEQPLNDPSRGVKVMVKEGFKDVKDVKDVRGSGGFSFETVWSRYPRKLGRKDAERHFKASVKTTQDFLDVQNALDCFIREVRKEGRPDDKIPYGSTWFFNWRDWVNYGGVQMPKPPAPKPRPPEVPPPDMTHDELLEMHQQTITVFKKCPTGPGCGLCSELAARQPKEVSSVPQNTS